MKIIFLTHNEECLVDDEDFDTLSKFKWGSYGSGRKTYARRVIYTINPRKQVNIFMHREILGIIGINNLIVDHIDHNGLNNQKYNIRICTPAQNVCNAKSAKNSTSKYLGVSFDKWAGRWSASICKNYISRRINRFDTEKEAALAYNEAAKRLHGEFANLNIVDAL